MLWDCRGNALGLLLDYREVATYLYEIAMGGLLDISVGCGIAVGWLWECSGNLSDIALGLHITIIMLVVVLWWDCCGNALGLLWDCCETHVKVLWEFCWIAVGLLWDCCGTAVGLLWDCCGIAVGLL